jgi:hypothetical protein
VGRYHRVLIGFHRQAAIIYKLIIAFILVLLVGQPFTCWGFVIRFQTHMENVSGVGWQAQDVALQWTQDGSSAGTLQLAIKRLELLPSLPPLHNIQLNCSRFKLDSEQAHCATGAINATIDGRSVKGQSTFVYLFTDDQVTFALTRLTLAGGQVELSGDLKADDWDLQLDANNLEAAALVGLLPAGLLTQEQSKGRLQLSATLAGRNGVPKPIRFQLSGHDLNLAAPSGRYASQDLDFLFKGRWLPSDGTFTARISSTGQLYLEPLFLELPTAPLTLDLAGQLRDDRVRLDTFTLNHPDVLKAGGNLTVKLGKQPGIRRVAVDIDEAIFPAVYGAYLQPFVADTVLGGLETAGRVEGRLDPLRRSSYTLTAVN